MKSHFIFRAECPDVQSVAGVAVEFIGINGEVLTEAQARAKPFFGTQDEAREELVRRRRIWSAIGDVFATDDNTRVVETKAPLPAQTSRGEADELF